jgi:hypothetical protein
MRLITEGYHHDGSQPFSHTHSFVHAYSNSELNKMPQQHRRRHSHVHPHARFTSASSIHCTISLAALACGLLRAPNRLCGAPGQ